MKKVGTIDVMVYRQKETRIVKLKKCKLKKSIKEIPQKLIKGKAISRSVECVHFPRVQNSKLGLENDEDIC